MKKSNILIIIITFILIYKCDVNSPKIFDNGPLTTLIYSYDINERKLEKIAEALNPVYFPMINSFVSTPSKGMILVNAETGQKKTITDLPDIWSYGISKDGSKIAISSYSKGQADLYIINSDGKNLQRITSTGNRFESYPIFSSNGKEILCRVSEEDFKKWKIVIYNLTALSERIIKEVKEPFNLTNISYIDNDNSVLYVETEKTDPAYPNISQLRMININDTSNDILIDENITEYKISPHGKLFFAETIKNDYDQFYSTHIFEFNLSTKSKTDYGVGEHNFSFSSDENYIVFLESDYVEKSIIHFKNLGDLSEESFVFEDTDFLVSQPFISNDNTRILFSARPKRENTE